METFEQRLDEINYRTELLKVQTQSLLKDLLSKLDEDALDGYDVVESCTIKSHIPGTLQGTAYYNYGENCWDINFDEMTHEDQLDLIKHITENKLYEKTV